MSKHGDTERSILKLFEDAEEFTFENENYNILTIGKPRPSKGECKTDIYILAYNLSTKENKEFKISIKQSDADFLENKISIERATEIFGDNAKEVMVKSIKSVGNSFLSDYLIYFQKSNNTESKCIKIGWKFELVDKLSGEKSGEIELTDEQKVDIYSGSNLNSEKKNAKVNGKEIENSGVANLILVVDNTDNNLDFYIDNLQPIEEFAKSRNIYFACKAINYRSKHDKWDGNRPLSVYVNWSLENDVISGEIVMNRPLEVRANDIGENIRNILAELKINSNNFEELKKYVDEKVNTYG